MNWTHFCFYLLVVPRKFSADIASFECAHFLLASGTDPAMTSTKSDDPINIFTRQVEETILWPLRAHKYLAFDE